MPSSSSASVVATREMCEYCFGVLDAHFAGGSDPAMPFVDAGLQCPMFITLKKGEDNGNGGGGGQLRGCIGTLSPKPLAAMRDYVHSSAFRDRRFKPLQQTELVDLDVCVSLLVNYEEVSNCHDWVVGVHGILIQFNDPDPLYAHKQYSATYLPEVASEQQWSQVETIASLLVKAGFRGAVSPELTASIRTTRYQSSKAYLRYLDFKAENGDAK